MPLPEFDKTKPFFPLVMNFAAQMIGFKETMAMADVLIIRKMTKKIVDASNLEGVLFQLTVSPQIQLHGYDLAYPFKIAFREMMSQSPNLPLERLLTHTAPFEIVGPRRPQMPHTGRGHRILRRGNRQRLPGRSREPGQGIECISRKPAYCCI